MNKHSGWSACICAVRSVVLSPCRDRVCVGKCIETRSGNIQITPYFNAEEYRDVVLVRFSSLLLPDVGCVLRQVTSAAFTEMEFLSWTYMLQVLNLTVNFWDVRQ